MMIYFPLLLIFFSLNRNLPFLFSGDLAFVPKKNFSENLPSENIFNLLDENSPPTGVYLFRNSNTALFSTVDCEGNKFTVCSSGDARVERAENFVNSSNGNVISSFYYF